MAAAMMVGFLLPAAADSFCFLQQSGKRRASGCPAIPKHGLIL
jgi:hypothetical protein